MPIGIGAAALCRPQLPREVAGRLLECRDRRRGGPHDLRARRHILQPHTSLMAAHQGKEDIAGWQYGG